MTFQVRTKITVFLSLLFLASGALPGDAIDVRADLDFGAEEEASPIQDPDISLRPNRSVGFLMRQARNKLSVKLPRGFHARLEHILTARRIKMLSLLAGFSDQELYRLQEVYRL